MFLPKEAGVSGNYKEKESQKPHPKLKIYIYFNFLHWIFVLPAIQYKCYFFANMYWFWGTTTQIFSLWK